jgi:hypothetical protein
LSTRGGARRSRSSSTAAAAATAAAEEEPHSLNEAGDVPASRESAAVREVISFATTSGAGGRTPVLLNAREHVVGYLSRILNARVYDVAVETELQEAKNLSAVREKKRGGERFTWKGSCKERMRTSLV